MPFWKPDPRPVAKVRGDRKAARAVERIKTKVRQYHKYTCLVCGRRTMVVHERLPRSLRGLVSLKNSFTACDALDGGVCHPLLQQGKIHAYNTVAGPDQNPRDFDAQEPITFDMAAKYAKVVFADRPQPLNVNVLNP